MPDKVHAEKQGTIGWVTFDHPERLNAVTQDMWVALGELLEVYERDDAVRVVVLKGAGDRAFVSGADISKFGATRASAEQVAESNRITGVARKRLQYYPKPTIAMINGYCLGGGLSIATLCDIRIASHGSKFGIPAAKLNIGYAPEGIGILQALVGPSFTREIMFTGRRLEAEEALRIGLINHLVSKEQLLPFTREFAETIGGNAPLSIRASKLSSLEWLKEEAERDLEQAKAAAAACFDSEDYREGRTAFMEKRPPVFRGR
ncbi:MAG: enoyl-CoA hydratase/isomerase family protein [Candidatus Lambdaproteobacteria bacterium]|nr:enoyl-CoA hydratase/isomerase family protein [Candidatus Lambdaproteobacteria bacterium]